MSIYVGVDVGAVGVKAALVLPRERAEGLLGRDGARAALRALHPPQPPLKRGGGSGDGPVNGGRDGGTAVLVASYRRTRGRPLETVREVLAELVQCVGAEEIAGITLTGSGSTLVAEALGVPRCNEFQAIARAIDLLYPHVRTVFELGGETSKYLRLEPDPGSGTLGILDYSTNGDCAAGTGAFLDQQAGRLKYAVEDIGRIVETAERAAQIAGRCSVFAKSDMIHAQQKAFTPPEVLRGLCNAVATNYKSAVVKGRTPVAPIALVGGVSGNSAVVRGLREVFELDNGALFVPEAAESLAAVGAAIIAAGAAVSDHGQDGRATDAGTRGRGDAGTDCVASHGQACPEQRHGSKRGRSPFRRPLPVLAGSHESGLFACLGEMGTVPSFPTSPPLTLERVTLLRDRVRPFEFPDDHSVLDAYLGIDVGSVGTKLVIIDTHGNVIRDIFTRTEGRPIEVVSRCLRELDEAVGSRVRICGVGTTGSGRELIGELVGADAITDEITCHKTGATFVGDRLLGKRPDTIFEIGGQDSKYISLQPEGRESRDTVVVDFTMNEACAAGTGSFLEERAEELGVAIKGEFSRLALASKAPIKLGERCTVFMERDVNTYMQRGAKREDVIAGLAYSVVYNYINRVVRGRAIGNCVFFQGGTAYNDAVAAAFSAVSGREIIVPPHNAVLGAIGAALVAKEKTTAIGSGTRFRGFDASRIQYSIREFQCKACGNRCAVQEFNVEGEKTYWGDKCSDRYRKRAKTDRKPIIPDLVALRRQLLDADDQGDPANANLTIGVPLTMYALDLLPLWRRFFRDCGFSVVVSTETNRQIVQRGLDCVVAEPCFPIIVAHGHVADLVSRNVSYIWLPNILSAETKFMDNESHVCPWGQTLPFVIRQAPAFRSWQGRILCPTIRLREGKEHLRGVLLDAVAKLGVQRAVAERAFEVGYKALQGFRSAYQEAGRDALAILERTGEAGMVIVGRPYNVHDPGVSLATARKLRDNYGVNVLPIDALPTADVDVRDVNENMYWEYGRKILAAAKIVGKHPNLHIIYITNFKCGPDSYVKAFIRPASGKPFLTLQFDGHSNDAGMMTRCEAYLDSKGILRWWRKSKSKPQAEAEAFGAERSTSPRWLTPAPG